MKRYKFMVEKITGKNVELTFEGNTEKDALASVNRNRFVMDLTSLRMVNTDHIVSIESMGEVVKSNEANSSSVS